MRALTLTDSARAPCVFFRIFLARRTLTRLRSKPRCARALPVPAGFFLYQERVALVCSASHSSLVSVSESQRISIV